MRQFESKPVARTAMNLFIGMTGASSSGKTFSALRLATGIQSVVGGDIVLIDTENRRSTMYADNFKFQHIHFDPPFGSLDYLEALEFAASKGAKTIIVDSMSHEHESIGGLIDSHEKELDRLAGDDWKKRERVAMLAWQKPKAARRKLLQGITRLNANVILCFRAKTTSKPIKNKDGKTEIVPMGFMPIAGDEFVYEMSLGCLLLPCSDGVPTWNPEHQGERMAVKLPAQFRSMIREGEPLSEELGAKLARWAQGSEPAAKTAPVAPPDDAIIDAAMSAARKGTPELQAHWKALTTTQKASLKPLMDSELKRIAKDMDDSGPDSAPAF